jgi:hypothetical protein
MTAREFLGKVLYNISSRSFIGFLFISIIYAFANFKILHMTGTEANSFQFLYNAVTSLEGVAFAAFLGKASFKSWLELKGTK